LGTNTNISKRKELKMNRTYLDIKGSYYDNLDKIIEWGEEIDVRYYNPEMYRAIQIERSS